MSNQNDNGCAFPARRGVSALAAVRRLRRARPVRQVHNAAPCGALRLHWRRRAAARRRRLPEHCGQHRVYQSIADNKGYAVPPTAKRRPHADRPDRSVQANASQTYCELGSMSTQPHVGRGVAVRTADSGDGRGGVPLVRMVVPVLVPTIRRLWQSYSIVCSACVHSAGSADLSTPAAVSTGTCRSIRGYLRVLRGP